MTTGLAHFRLLNPANIDEAVAAARSNPGSRYVAGGTDLLVNLRRGIGAADALIDLTGIGELNRIDDSGPGLIIGSMVGLAELASNKRLAEQYAAESGRRCQQQRIDHGEDLLGEGRSGRIGQYPVASRNAGASGYAPHRHPRTRR